MRHEVREELDKELVGYEVRDELVGNKLVGNELVGDELQEISW